ncbi:MAG: hypothetical protein KKA35_16045 [Proteobacteria bacterium]|nr:hypothetical protein [Pseudomonadota bacterium]
MNNINQENNIGLLLEKKILFATKYLSATEEMKEALMQKEEDVINYILKRQDCMNKINKIDISLQKVIRPNSERFRKIFNNYLDGIKNLLEQIVPIDAEIMLMVKAESRGVKEELLKINNIRHATKGFGTKRNQIPRYLDARR